MVVIIFLCGILVCFFSIIWWAYAMAFGMREAHANVDFDIPQYTQYQNNREKIKQDVNEILNDPYEKVTILSKDGLKLIARYYRFSQEAPIVILFHGYRSSAARDNAGGYKTAKALGYNVLLVDQRAHGDSQGRTITMGVKERYDCLEWVSYVVRNMGEDIKILLMGLSMGASTVLMTSELELPENVCGIIGDCGYSDIKEILSCVGAKVKLPFHIKLPKKVIYFLTRMGAILYGKFDPEAASPQKALRHCRLPVLLIHGEQDQLVPLSMSWDNYNACSAKKEILIIPDANHGMSYYMDTKQYTEKVGAFMQKCLEK